MFTVSEITDETLIQQAVSPDGARVASVYFRPVGAYSGGSGRIFVRVSPRLMPFIERDIYYVRVSSADENTTNYLKWVDDHTVYISERKQIVEVGWLQLKMPEVFAIPLNMIRFVATQTEEAQLEAEQTMPLKDIPTYPGQIEHPNTSYVRVYQTAERVYFLPGSKLDDVSCVVSECSAFCWLGYSCGRETSQERGNVSSRILYPNAENRARTSTPLLLGDYRSDGRR